MLSRTAALRCQLRVRSAAVWPLSYSEPRRVNFDPRAGIVEILVECGVSDDAVTQEVHHLVCAHEVGGDPRSELLKDADSISYFDVNLPLYFEREG